MVKKNYQNGDKNHYLTKTVKKTLNGPLKCVLKIQLLYGLYNCKNLLELKIEVL